MKTLTIITRCHPKREYMQNVCRRTVELQSCDDYEHMFLEDPTEDGQGVHASNEMLQNFTPSGKYAMVLDDDDGLMYTDFVKDFVELVKATAPDIVVFRGTIAPKGVYPPDHLWGHRPVRGKIGSFCFAVTQDLWNIYAGCWQPSDGFPNMADFTFINACWDAAGRIEWMDRVATGTQMGANRGKGE